MEHRWCLVASAFFCFVRHRFAEEMRHVDGQLLERDGKNERTVAMLWTLVFILLVLWLLGLITSYTAGGLIHLLLVVALVVVVIRLLQGRRPLT
jgi:predicted nucleic acid-binding Zn ribbon protein